MAAAENLAASDDGGAGTSRGSAHWFGALAAVGPLGVVAWHGRPVE